MTDDELSEFLAALDRVTTALETEGVTWSRLIRISTGHAVIPFDPSDKMHRELVGSLARAAAELVESANSTRMAGWGVARVNELGNALEEQFSRIFNDLGGLFQCRGFSQSTGYPDRRITLEDRIVAYVDLKTFDSGSETSTFRSFYHQPRKARGKISTAALHLLVAFPHGPAEGGSGRYSWKLEGSHIVDLAELRVKLKGEFQASNRDLYRVLSRISIEQGVGRGPL
jgi:hypothetical protein